MTIPTFNAYRDILRADLSAFSHRAFKELHPDVPFHWNWHIDVICSRLLGAMAGKTLRLAICLPPRHLKSHLVSVAFPAFVLGHKPNTRIICASYAQVLSDSFARESLQLMESPFYKAIFETRIERSAASDFTTTMNGGRFATSVGGVLTGAGGDILIVDDPLKADDAMSEFQRSRANSWMDNTLYSRLNNKERGVIIIVMQRLHEDDLIGHVLVQEGWEVVSFPAIATQDESFSIKTPYGPRRYSRKSGEPLHAARESLATLESMRKRLGSAAFAAQYQQAPKPPEGLFVKEAWFPSYTPETLPKTFDRIVISWDTANKISEVSDFSACTAWGTKAEKIYLLDVIRDKWEMPELERKVVEVAGRYSSPKLLIEDCASGQQLIQKLARLGHQVVACKPEGDKQMRLYSQIPTMEQGLVHLPEHAPWRQAFLDELKAFPNGKHDDQVDSTSQALRWIATTSAEPGLLTHYKNLVHKQNPRPGEVSFLVPEGHVTLQTISKGVITVGPDRIVTVSGQDVLAYRRLGWKESNR